MSTQTEVDTLYQKAKRAVQQKATQRAMGFLAKALALNPNDIPCLDLLGFILFFQKRYAESERCCRRALAQKPNHAYALAGLGMNRARQGYLEEGRASLEKAMQLQPNWAEPYWDLAVLFKDARRYSDALDTLNRAIEACPSDRVRFEKLLTHIEGLVKKRGCSE